MDRSLDEFTAANADATDADEGSADDTGKPAEDDVTDDGRPDETVAGDDPTPDEPATEDGTGGPSLTVRPATSTMDWTPDGAACESCGTAVERRWRDDGRLVCPECKQW